MEDYDIVIASDSYSSEAEEDPCEKHSKIDLGDSLQSISISPIKTDSMPKHVKVSYEKIGKAMSTLKRSFATAIGIEKDLCKTENTKLSYKQKGAHFNFFWGVAGLEDFACATLPTIPLDFQAKVLNFCHPTLLKIRFEISVTPLLLDKGQNQNYGASINSNGLLTLSGLLSLKFLLHMTTSLINENHFNNCI